MYLIYIITIIVVAGIVISGFINARRKMAQFQNNDVVESAPETPKIYEKQGINQKSSHPLGAVQSVIYGRIRFVWIGSIFIGFSLFGLYAIYSGKLEPDVMEAFGGRTTVNMLIVTVLLAGGIVWGFKLIIYATYRIRLRRTGFEISSILGTKAYEYKDVDFYLEQTIQHKYESEGYQPIWATGNYHWIWKCQVLFRDGRPPIFLKSSRYIRLRNKIQNMMNAMEKEK